MVTGIFSYTLITVESSLDSYIACIKWIEILNHIVSPAFTYYHSQSNILVKLCRQKIRSLVGLYIILTSVLYSFTWELLIWRQSIVKKFKSITHDRDSTTTRHFCTVSGDILSIPILIPLITCNQRSPIRWTRLIHPAELSCSSYGFTWVQSRKISAAVDRHSWDCIEIRENAMGGRYLSK